MFVYDRRFHPLVTAIYVFDDFQFRFTPLEKLIDMGKILLLLTDLPSLYVAFNPRIKLGINKSYGVLRQIIVRNV